MVPHPELEEWRAEFPLLAATTYLNSCSLGALPRRGMAALEAFVGLWNRYGASAWYDRWLTHLDELRGRVARLWRARPTEIALLPSVSAALGAVGSALHVRRRPRIVVAELDFPTQIYAWMARPDVELVRLPSDDGATIDPERWRQAIDDRTAAVVTSHVFYATGAVQDLPSLATWAHDAGALLIVDGYQAAGQLDVDPRVLGADVYIAGPLKWLLGGPGLAYLWVREERLDELRPTLVSWFGADDQFAFRPDVFRWRPDARRFELGTPALPTAYTAAAGLDVMLEAGPARVAARTQALGAYTAAAAQRLGLPLRQARNPAQRSAIVLVGPLSDAADVVRGLARQGIVVDHRGAYVRVSPHFYNTVEEIDRALAALAALVPERERSVVPNS